MSGCYNQSIEDSHFERKLNGYLDQEPEDEYIYPPEVEIELWGKDSRFPYGQALIKKRVKGEWIEIYTSGYFVDTRFYAEEEKEFYPDRYWRLK